MTDVSPAISAPGEEPITPGEPPAPAAPPSAAAGATGQALLELALTELGQRRQSLGQEIAQLEARRDQLAQEISGSFAGQSDAVARRVKGFQEYLVGALQDLALAAEQMPLVPETLLVQPSPLDQLASEAQAPEPPAAPLAAGLFAADAPLIRQRLAEMQGQPDFYANPWCLRRSLEARGAQQLEDWFLGQGGRGAQPSAGSRNRNVLLAAAAVALLAELYGDRFQTLVLASQPERLGEWRRGLQDCLGLGREDFGPSSGIVLFERADALIERADRLEERGELPFILVDAAEQVVDVPILQFPLWLAFAASPGELSQEEAYD